MYLGKPDIGLLFGKSLGAATYHSERNVTLLLSCFGFFFFNFAHGMDGWMGGVATVGSFSSFSLFSLGKPLGLSPAFFGSFLYFFLNS